MTRSAATTDPAAVDLAPMRDKVVIVTGASRGIGADTARVLARAGAMVVVAARDEERLRTVADDIFAEGGEAIAVRTDVTQPADIERLVERTVQTFGRLDAAFNNAGGGEYRPAPMHELSIEDFDRTIDVNLRSLFLSLKYEIPAMLHAGGGSIVNMSSKAGLSASARGISPYVAAKHGVIGLTKIAATEYADRNIRVNAVAPGPVYTDRIAALTDEQRAPITDAVPLGRIASTEEVANAVAWLLSDRSSYVTGVALPIDGGLLAL